MAVVEAAAGTWAAVDVGMDVEVTDTLAVVGVVADTWAAAVDFGMDVEAADTLAAVVGVADT